MHTEERLLNEVKSRGFNESENTKQNETKSSVTPKQRQTEHPEDTSSRHLWPINYGELTARTRLLWLSSPRSLPSRSGILLRSGNDIIIPDWVDAQKV